MTFINTPWLILKVIDLVYSFLNPFSAQKTKIFGEDYGEYFDEKLGRENLENKYGGWIPDKKSNFFPPRYDAKG